MPILLKNSVDKGVATFDLRTPTAIAKMNGTITGSPTFDNDGIDLDGSNDYITYVIPNTLLTHSKISFVLEFTPDFDYDEDVTRYLFGSTSNKTRLVKYDNGSSNVLNFKLNGVSIFSVTNYTSYWKPNEKNILVISSKSGSTNCWLNGTKIVTNDGSSYTADIGQTALYIGAATGGGSKFKGKMHSVTVHNDLMINEDGEYLYNNSEFNFQNKADIWLDMIPYGDTEGRELVIDGDMEASGTSDWTVGSSAVLTKDTTDPYSGTQCLRVAYGGVNYPYAAQNILISGKEYHATGWARGDGTHRPALYSGGYIWQGTTSTDWQSFDVTFTAGEVLIRLYLDTSGDGYVEFDNISIKEKNMFVVKDKSGSGRDFAVTDAAFLNPGFNLSGTADYLTCTCSLGAYGNDEQTIVSCFSPDFATGEDAKRNIYSDSLDDYRAFKRRNVNGNVLLINMGSAEIISIAESVYNPYWKVGGVNVLIVSAKSAGTDVWLNGALIVDNDTTSWTSTSPTFEIIGSKSSFGDYFKGNFYHFSTYPFKFTPMQVRQITAELTNKY